MSTIGSTILGTLIWNFFFLTVCGHYWRKVRGDDLQKQLSFALHVGKGFIFPIIVWIACNAGWFPTFIPFVPHMVDLQSTPRPPGYVAKMIVAFAPSFTVIGSAFAGVTLAMLRMSSVASNTSPSKLRRILHASSWVLAVLILFSTGPAAIGFATIIVVLPMLYFATEDVETDSYRPKPFYVTAEIHIKFGRYEEAEAAILRELEKEPDDFDGWMMLANLYAHQYGDLDEAAATVHQLVRQSNVSAFQASFAINQLADWHLDVGSDPETARAALETILDLHPGTHSARMARIRINRLPASTEEFQRGRDRRKISVGNVRQFEQPVQVVQIPTNLDRSDAKDLANACSANLSENPNDAVAREKLALLLGDHLEKHDEAINQLRLLLGIPDQPPPNVARWMNQIATWQLESSDDTSQARTTLSRLLELLPRTLYAFNAQRRLTLIEQEFQKVKGTAPQPGHVGERPGKRKTIKLSD